MLDLKKCILSFFCFIIAVNASICIAESGETNIFKMSANGFFDDRVSCYRHDEGFLKAQVWNYAAALLQIDLNKSFEIPNPALQLTVRGRFLNPNVTESDSARVTLSCYRVLSPWKEDHGFIEGNNIPVIGLNIAAKPFASIQMNDLSKSKKGAIIEIPGFAKAIENWHSGKWKNYGFLAKLETGGNTKLITLSFFSRKDESRFPKIVESQFTGTAHEIHADKKNKLQSVDVQKSDNKEKKNINANDKSLAEANRNAIIKLQIDNESPDKKKAKDSLSLKDNGKVLAKIKIIGNKWATLPLGVNDSGNLAILGSDETIKFKKKTSGDEILYSFTFAPKSIAKGVQIAYDKDLSQTVQLPPNKNFTEPDNGIRTLSQLLFNASSGNPLLIRVSARANGQTGRDSVVPFRFHKRDGKKGIQMGNFNKAPSDSPISVTIQVIKGERAKSFKKIAKNTDIAAELSDAGIDGMAVLLHRDKKYAFLSDEIKIVPELVDFSKSTDRAYTVSLRVFESDDNIVYSREDEIIKDKNIDPIIFKAEKCGVYRIVSKIINLKDNKELNEHETLVAVLPKHGYKKGEDTGLGFVRTVHVRADDKYRNQLALDAGISWYRFFLRYCLDYKIENGQIKASIKPGVLSSLKNVKGQGLKILADIHTSFSKRWSPKPLYEKFQKLKDEEPEEYLKMNEKFLNILAKNLAPYVDAWEVFNEPYYEFSPLFSGNSSKNINLYVRLSALTKKIIRKYSDKPIVGICGPPHSIGYSWYSQVMGAGDLNNIDAVSTHPYAVGLGTEHLPLMQAKAIRQIIAKNGGKQPVWNTEYGVFCNTFHRLPQYSYPVAMSAIYRQEAQKGAMMMIKQTMSNIAGGIEKNFVYTMTGNKGQNGDILEYDGTPKHVAVALAALSKFLKDLKFKKELQEKNAKYLKVFQFGGESKTVLFFMTYSFHKGDSMEIIAPKGKWKYYDIYSNPITPEANGKIKLEQAPIWAMANEPMEVDTVKICNIKRPRKKIATKGFDTTSENDWMNRTSINLRKFVNRGFYDEIVDDGLGGWTDEGLSDMRNLATGKHTLGGIPFDIINPERNSGKSAVVLKSSGGIYKGPEKVTIPIGFKTSRIHFLHTATYCVVPVLGKCIINYIDGSKREIPMRNGFELVETRKVDKELKNGKIGWIGNAASGRKACLSVFTWINPTPTLDVESIEIQSVMGLPRYALLALTCDVAL